MEQLKNLSAADSLNTRRYIALDRDSSSQSIDDEDPSLVQLIKAKFGGYLRWTVFSMLLAPIAFWIISRH